MSSDKKVTVGSGNVFADLGFANPEEELLKAKLIREIRSIIKRRKLTQAKAAILLGLKQPDVSSIITGRVGKFCAPAALQPKTTASAKSRNARAATEYLRAPRSLLVVRPCEDRWRRSSRPPASR